jgi:hypothetical protein
MRIDVRAGEGGSQLNYWLMRIDHTFHDFLDFLFI